MAALFSHLQGDQDSATIEGIPELVAELDHADGEHTDVSVEHESGWTLSAYREGLVVWENVKDDQETGRLYDVPRDEVATMFAELARGDIVAVAVRPWGARRP